MPRNFFVVLKSQDKLQPTPFDQGDDFTDPVKAKAVEHAVTITAKNEFPVAPGVSEFSIRDPLGNPVPLGQGEANGQETYAERNLSAQGKANLDSQSNSKLHKFTVTKGKLPKSDSNSFTGVDLIKDVNTKLGKSEVAMDTERAVAENNGGFSETNQYTNENGKTRTERTLKLGATAFSSPGVYPGRKFPTATEDKVSEASRLSIAELTKMGTLMMLEASGEAVIPDPNDPAFGVLGELQATAPAVARTFGAKIEASRFAPSVVIKHIKKDFVASDNTSFLDGTTALSWGNTNNSMAPFDGLTALPSITSATLLIATVTTALLGLSLVLNGIKTQGTGIVSNQAPENRQRFFGSWRGKPYDDTLLKVIGLEIVPITHDASVTLRKGIEVFFGQDTGGSGGAAANVAAGVGRTVPLIHGYYNTVLRAVVRSLVSLGYPIGEVASGRQEISEIRQAADPTVLIKQLNRSPLLGFINILLTIGDKALTQDEQRLIYGGDFMSSVNSAIDSIKETIDQVDDKLTGNPGVQTLLNPAVLIAKNRLSNGPHAGRLSMANATARSLFYVPSRLGVGLDGVEYAVKNAKASLTQYNTVKGATGANASGKIDKDVAAAMEEHLESDYMPFYFEDMRTNEILSFHAFLENINEDISADYNETEGFGRLGSVYTYKNTKRSIGFSFMLVSTSDEDFDLMWYKINRLGMMLYPQWSEGRRITYEGKSFIQPFSQVVAASPLVRLRLGDLWKSNYNKLSVARLFGYGSSGFNLASQQARAQAANTERERQQAELENRIQQELNADHITYGVNEYVNFQGQSSHYPWVNDQNIVIGSISPSRGFVRIVAASPDDPLHKIVEPILSASKQKFKVPAAELSRDAQQVRHRLAPPGATTSGTEFDEQRVVTEFFSADNNPILRSFESAMGKGLAGFVKSMRMGYEQARWATHKLNGRAPMMVKIDMEFALIHDLQPGLGADGFMSAPLWNVGDIMKGVTGDTQSSDKFSGDRSSLTPNNSNQQPQQRLTNATRI